MVKTEMKNLPFFLENEMLISIIIRLVTCSDRLGTVHGFQGVLNPHLGRL
jgi:hypothetical protein